MTRGLEGIRVAVLATDGVEQVELTEPVKALREAGAVVHLIEPDGNPVQGFNHLDKGDVFPADASLRDATDEDYAALLLPGGVANPDALRLRPDAVRFVRAFFEADKPVAAICHAPWLLIEADVVKGRTLTSWPSLRKDLENAGATWVDEPVQVDQRLITSRKPEDLPAFSRRIVLDFASQADESKVDSMVEQTFPASDPLPGP
ncbi:MAG TPA: type 1 glutamine amidotransferase domain-containing protein [Gemmatimonadaceae bacterium]|nr:type 1 glutamine amidotransferase domain-containing protein [Gemmatimonadaceae bacterium]